MSSSPTLLSTMINTTTTNNDQLKLKQYGPVGVIITAYILLNMFGKGRSVQAQRSFWGALMIALKSRTLWGMLLSSLGVAMSLRKALGWSIGKTFGFAFSLMYSLIYTWKVVEAPTVSFKRTYWNSTIVEKSRIASTMFYPVFWAFNAHAQTVSCFVLSHLEWFFWAEPINFEREYIPAFDSPNELFLDWASPSSEAKHKIQHHKQDAKLDSPVILCIHGLGDDRDVPYLKRFSRSALERGYRVAIFSYWRYDFEESRDVQTVLDRIQDTYPNSPIIACAWSAGAYTLIRYLEKAGHNTPLLAAVCQSGCLDFAQAVHDVFAPGIPSTYAPYLSFQGRICVYRHLQNDKRLTTQQQDEIKRALAEESNPLSLYDRFLRIIQPLGSHPDKPNERHILGHQGDVTAESIDKASHYVHRASKYLHKIEVSTLLLHAEDDPVVTSEHIDWSNVEANRHITVVHTRRGGHCSYYEGLAPFGTTWGDRVSLNWISAVLETHSQTTFFLELIRQSSDALKKEVLATREKNTNGKVSLSKSAMARIVSVSDLASLQQ
jgi:predicted alpha/beta-fold hydrolase